MLWRHTDAVNGLAFSPNGKYLATGSWDNTVGLWDTITWKMVRRFIGHTNRVTSVAFSPDSNLLASGGNDRVKLWDSINREDNPRKIVFNEDYFCPIHLTFSTGGHPLGRVSNKTKELVLWDCDTHQKQSFGFIPNTASGTALSPDKKTLAIGTEDGAVMLFNITSHDVIYKLQTHLHRSIDALAYSPDGRFLAIGSGDPAVITLWDVASWKLIGRFQHSNAAQGMAFSPDGKKLAVASWQGYVYLWDFAGSPMPRVEDLPRLSAHTKPVNDVAFSPDGKTLATSSEDKTIKLWNVATLREMITLHGPTTTVRHVAFSPDGKCLAASDNHSVWVWQAAPFLPPSDPAKK